MNESLLSSIGKEHVEKAIKTILFEGYPAKRKSNSYDLIFSNVAFPPKYVMSLAGYFANGRFLSHELFHGGPKKECFNILEGFGYSILPKNETTLIEKANKVNDDIHLKYANHFIDHNLFRETEFNQKFEEYYNYAKRSQWLKYSEAYKFRFAKWLNDRVDFSKQTDEEILRICIESQNQKYSEEGTGVNFIVSALRFQDDFIVLNDIKMLRRLNEGSLLEVNDLKSSPLSFPKLSCWAGTLIPEHYRIYANEELTTGLISLFEIEDYPKTGIRSFNLANSCLMLLSKRIKDIYSKEVDELLSLIFPKDYIYSESYLSWLTQDFILFITRRIMNSTPNYFWVNQGKQFDEELENSCITAPVDTIYHHKKLKDLKEGDIIINYSNTAIRAISKVVKEFTTGERPFRPDEDNHLVVKLNYSILDTPVPLSNLQELFKPNRDFLPNSHSPFNSKFNINQSYLLDFNKKSFDLIFPENGIDFSEVSEPDSDYKIPKYSYPLNSILFGPPGTGKTYNTINKALEICGIEVPVKREDAIDKFDKLSEEGRIVFTTFHQSMTYEDFIEGIKPQEPDEEGHPVIFKIEPGIFKKIAIEAAFSMAQKNSSVETENVLDFSKAFDDFKDKVEEMLDKKGKVDLDTKNGGKVHIDSISQQGNFILKHLDRDVTYTVSKSRLSKLNNSLPPLDQVKNINSEFNEIIGGSNATVNWAVLNEIRNKYLRLVNTKHKQREITWEEKYEAVKKFNKSDYKGKNGEPHVLIIDEINRGNVSAIFGELITLIEDDKRLGKEEGLVAQLPYSKEKFGVPPNLYIIGTMNTADRSVEALDTALRRRFSFEEKPPQPIKIQEGNGLTEIKGISLENLLLKINRRLEKLLDKDHMIGHSFFMNLQNIIELKLVFHNKILPLLQEYFFGDFGKIELIVGKEFFEKNEDEEGDYGIFADSDYPVNGLGDRRVYHIQDIMAMNDDDFVYALEELLK